MSIKYLKKLTETDKIKTLLFKKEGYVLFFLMSRTKQMSALFSENQNTTLSFTKFSFLFPDVPFFQKQMTKGTCLIIPFKGKKTLFKILRKSKIIFNLDLFLIAYKNNFFISNDISTLHVAKKDLQVLFYHQLFLTISNLNISNFFTKKIYTNLIWNNYE